MPILRAMPTDAGGFPAMAAGPGWMRDERRRCSPDRPEVYLFTSDNYQDKVEAKLLCQRCPVREECLNWALDQGEMHNVWGGVDMSIGDERYAAIGGRRPIRELVQQLWSEDLSDAEIARRLSVGRKSIWQHRNALGLPALHKGGGNNRELVAS